MAKTQKELAFLRDLYIDEEWTQRFTELLDENFKFGDEKKILYLNAGTGSHALALREKIDADTEFFASAENEDLLTIARDKAAAVKAKIEFANLGEKFADASFDAVVADGSFARPENLREIFETAGAAAKSGAQVAVLTVTAGSFGEIFSFLWEVFLDEDINTDGAAVEKLISELPSVSDAEEFAAEADLISVESKTKNEIFEYKNGAEFVESTLVGDFLLPVWLDSLSEAAQAKVSKKLAQIVDADDGDLSFRFSVKATLVTGTKK